MKFPALAVPHLGWRADVPGDRPAMRPRPVGIDDELALEGILRSDHYDAMLTALIGDYAGQAFAYYLNISFEETLRRRQ